MVLLDRITISLSYDDDDPDQHTVVLTAALRQKLGEHLAIVEDELRQEFGDVAIDWS